MSVDSKWKKTWNPNGRRTKEQGANENNTNKNQINNSKGVIKNVTTKSEWSPEQTYSFILFFPSRDIRNLNLNKHFIIFSLENQSTKVLPESPTTCKEFSTDVCTCKYFT